MSWSDVVTAVLDERAVVEASLIALGSSVSALFYYLYRKQAGKSKKVEDAPAFNIDLNLTSIVRDAPFSSLPYVAISGRVSSSGEVLSCFADQRIKGVLWKKVTTEHKDVWHRYTHTWDSSEKEISSVFDSVPFNLTSDSSYASVKVIDHMESSWINDSIEVVHEKFTPSSSNFAENIFGFVSGDRLKGFTDTESMLRLGTKVCAVGELVYEDGVLMIRPPSNGVGDYIISKYSQKEIVSQMRENAIIFKVFALLMGAASLTALYFIGRRLWKKYKGLLDAQRMQDEINEIREQRTIVAGRLNREAGDNNPCVVCLTNPRECVILNCGHICVCVDCLEALPVPKECPLCRSTVIRTVPLFNV